MNIMQVSSSKWRIRQTYKGKSYSITLDHKPGKREAAELIQAKIDAAGRSLNTGTLLDFMKEYINIKSQVLSPSTIRSYTTYTTILSEGFLSKDIDSVTQSDIQAEINKQSATHSPKTVRNYHGFITAVLQMYRPDMTVHTTMPQKKKASAYIPTEEDVAKLLEAVQGSNIEIAVHLGILACRRGEVCAITSKDLNGNLLTINKDVVESNDGLKLKNTPKTDASNRVIYLPDYCAELLRKQVKAFDGHPGRIVYRLHQFQDQLGIPRFRFHDLRHYFATYAHAHGVPDKYIQAVGGWATDYVMKSVYTHAQEEASRKKMQELAEGMLGK